ncbi:hypothetical protein M011DRAFT_394506 [Sporormia fimetaria CBS 119925]|uniref:Tyrosine--tRNA ligase n=1 Tax=Sporormia fimetaria CBS 119925 TaxID=1340428 RepID=A0A6A6VN71_9PLEO|nr:hypothetical protein M011DRAFT_394506 [Sporormia fimetaria CBS 119925]
MSAVGRLLRRKFHRTAINRADPDPWGSQARLTFAAQKANKHEAWAENARKIKAGNRKSMLTLLEERGLVKDIAGGRQALNNLLTEKPIGAYVGVDPTAPSLHVGHLLPLMALFWMYLHGYTAVTLLGTGTVRIGDPSGRTTARSRQSENEREQNCTAMRLQLKRLWQNVIALGVKHEHKNHISRERQVLLNHTWLEGVPAMDLVTKLGSEMRLGAMLAKDTVRTRLEGDDGMSLSEFLYPLFQGYDWWHQYKTWGVQMQLGGSDQYGNICAGMEAVDAMRRHEDIPGDLNDPLKATYGITTPLLTTPSGEKFGKSAGNAVWLDKDMMSSFDLYQYFLSTPDTHVERYLKLFTFFPSDEINLAMRAQEADPSKRIAQHLLAKSVVELAHGANAAVEAEQVHKSIFAGRSTITFDKSALGGSITSRGIPAPQLSKEQASLLEHKLRFAGKAKPSSTAAEAGDGLTGLTVHLPESVVQSASDFSQVLLAAGLVSSKSAGRRLIDSRGAYVVVPRSSDTEDKNILNWSPIEPQHTPKDFVIQHSERFVVVRYGKSKLRICRLIDEWKFKRKGRVLPEEVEMQGETAPQSEQEQKKTVPSVPEAESAELRR